MEQKLGNFGEATENYAKGVVTVGAKADLPVTGFGLKLGVQLNAELDAKVLIAFLAAKIGGPIPAEVASFLEAALNIT